MAVWPMYEGEGDAAWEVCGLASPFRWSEGEGPVWSNPAAFFCPSSCTECIPCESSPCATVQCTACLPGLPILYQGECYSSCPPGTILDPSAPADSLTCMVDPNTPPPTAPPGQTSPPPSHPPPQPPTPPPPRSLPRASCRHTCVLTGFSITAKTSQTVADRVLSAQPISMWRSSSWCEPQGSVPSTSPPSQTLWSHTGYFLDVACTHPEARPPPFDRSLPPCRTSQQTSSSAARACSHWCCRTF